MTTTDKIRTRIIALRDRARHPNTPPAEADTALILARKLCAKHAIDVSILDAKPEPQRTTDAFGSGTFVKKYNCTFGCPPFTQHTIEELKDCAERARARGFTYSQAKPKRDPFEDIFRDFWRGHDHERSQSEDGAFYTDSRGRTREHRARAGGPHAYCDHPATKAARAKCRKERGY